MKGGSNRFLTTADLAEMLAVPVRTVREEKDKWGLPYHRIGRNLRFRERDVESWLLKSSSSSA